jgi:hypothetical protein
MIRILLIGSVIGITGINGLTGLNSQEQPRKKAGQYIGNKARKQRRAGSLQRAASGGGSCLRALQRISLPKNQDMKQDGLTPTLYPARHA